MSQLDKTFPTNDCAMCTMAPRLVEISGNRDIEKLTLCELESLEGEAGNLTVTLRKKPRYVDESKCTGCGACVTNCPTRNLIQLDDGRRAELEFQFKEQVSEIIDRNRGKNGPLMPILQEIDAALHYFPPGVLDFVSQETGYPLTHLLRIATFYSAFSVVPRGKYVIKVCMGTACYVKGSERILDRFSEILGVSRGGTTDDMRFTLESLRCIGCCGLAPAVAVGTEVFGKTGIKEVQGIVDAKVQDAEARDQ